MRSFGDAIVKRDQSSSSSSRSRSRECESAIRRSGPMNGYEAKSARLLLMERAGMFDTRDEERKRREELKRLKDMKGGQPGVRRLDGKDPHALIRLLRELKPGRDSIMQAMGWCIDRADCAAEVATSLVDGLMEGGIPLEDRILRLYVLSDVLHNSGSTTQKAASKFRREFESHLPLVFERLHLAYRGEQSRLTAQRAANQVLRVLHSWQEAGIFGPEFVKGLEVGFLKDIVSVKALLQDADSTYILESVLLQLQNWSTQHFSQLEKIGKSRGLNWQTGHLEPPYDGMPLEEVKKCWILDRLVTYELYVVDAKRKEVAAAPARPNKAITAGGTAVSPSFFNRGMPERSAGRQPKAPPGLYDGLEEMPSGPRGPDFDDIDGESVSDGEWAECHESVD